MCGGGAPIGGRTGACGGGGGGGTPTRRREHAFKDDRIYNFVQKKRLEERVGELRCV